MLRGNFLNTWLLLPRPCVSLLGASTWCCCTFLSSRGGKCRFIHIDRCFLIVFGKPSRVSTMECQIEFWRRHITSTHYQILILECMRTWLQWRPCFHPPSAATEQLLILQITIPFHGGQIENVDLLLKYLRRRKFDVELHSQVPSFLQTNKSEFRRRPLSTGSIHTSPR